MEQTIYSGAGSCARLPEVFASLGVKRMLLVCGRSFDRLPIRTAIEAMDVELVRFSDFRPNPDYEDIRKGAELFNGERCEAILTVGGGSAIDVAKCVKLYCKMDPTQNFLRQPCADTGVPLIALPTTAGTGSESTRFAVIYYQGEKQSVKHDSILPDYVILEPEVLADLPVYQKKCTLLDALCQAIESWWSVNSTEESKGYARAAIAGIVNNWRAYVFEGGAAEEILRAANLAGRAINITQTTAPHAMSYKMTKLYGLPHGHAVALGLPEVWEYMNADLDGCIDPRGREYLRNALNEIAAALGGRTAAEGVAIFRALLAELGIESPHSECREKDLDMLAASVNPVRLKNNPVALTEDVLREMYERIVQE